MEVARFAVVAHMLTLFQSIIVYSIMIDTAGKPCFQLC